MMKVILFLVVFWAGLVCHAAGPVAVWHFDEGRGAETLEENRKGGAGLMHFPKAVRWIPGRSGAALHFSGTTAERNSSGYAKFSFPKETFTRPFSIELWFRLDSGVHYQETREIINAGCEKTPGFRVYYYYRKMVLYTGNGGRHHVFRSSKVMEEIPPDLWHFLTLTYDGSRLKLYLNGEQMIDVPQKLEYYRMFNLGSYHGYVYPLIGAVDEMKIYDCALSPEEILENYIHGSL